VHTSIPVATGNTSMLLDNTAPLITEGTEIVTQNITPTSASNDIMIDVFFSYTTDSDDKEIVVAVFRDSTCIAAQSFATPRNDKTHPGMLKVIDSPASASAVTYSVRVGENGASVWYINRDKAGTTLGGLRSTTGQFTLTEIS
jgi:hypothetical protein